MVGRGLGLLCGPFESGGLGSVLGALLQCSVIGFVGCPLLVNATTGFLPGVSSDGNIRDAGSAEGNVPLAAKVEVVKWASEDPNNVNQFLRRAD